VESDTASVVCGQASFTVKTLNPDDFPRFPEVTPDQTITIPTNVFADLVGHVARAVSRDETRPILTGVLLVVDGPSIRMVATDSYRLAVKETILETAAGEPGEVVIPAKALEEAGKLAGSQENISIKSSSCSKRRRSSHGESTARSQTTSSSSQRNTQRTSLSRQKSSPRRSKGFR